MAIGFWQKIRLGLAGWSRRRREAEARRRREFLERELSWGERPDPAAPSGGRAASVDLEGLQIAWLDGSGRIDYYLDVESGEVVEVRPGDEDPRVRDEGRYRRVPSRPAGDDLDERREFVRTVEREDLRRRLEAALEEGDAVQAFRRELATSREAERAWSKFRNERASRAAEAWVRSIVG